MKEWFDEQLHDGSGYRRSHWHGCALVAELMTVVLVAVGCVALAAATAASTYLFFGHYWHVLLANRKADQ